MYKEEIILAEQAYANRNDKKAYNVFLKYAELDDLYSQVCLGYLLIHGIGVKEDDKKGYAWIKKAADKNDQVGQYWYAKCALEFDEELAVKYFKASSDQGSKDAKLDYARSLFEGTGCQVNKKEAIKLFKENFHDKHLETMRLFTDHCINFRCGFINSIKGIYYFFKTIKQAGKERYIPGSEADLKCPIKEHKTSKLKTLDFSEWPFFDKLHKLYH